jgi:hypothetical protein
LSEPLGEKKNSEGASEVGGRYDRVGANPERISLIMLLRNSSGKGEQKRYWWGSGGRKGEYR